MTSYSTELPGAQNEAVLNRPGPLLVIKQTLRGAPSAAGPAPCLLGTPIEQNTAHGPRPCSPESGGGDGALGRSEML